MAKTIVAAVLVSAAMGGAAFAQDATSLSAREVVGDWTLAITPAERDDLAISVQSRDGGQPDLPLTITSRPNGRLDCVLRDDPADCRIRDGRLIVVMAGGGVRMTYTLTARNRDRFSGTASVRVRFLPIGGEIGTVSMTRR